MPKIPFPCLPMQWPARLGGPRALALAAALALPALQWSGGASADQRAMVVGIDDYRHGHPDASSTQLSDLKGAVNDAHLLVDALRKAGVEVAAERVLLNAQATRANVLSTWDALRGSAQPGDTLILAFSGHGGQEQEEPALGIKDETDGRDETLMLHDFDPANPQLGRITDDELYGMFAGASEFEILFVADTCHAAGLNKRRRTEHSRLGGTFGVASGARLPPERLAVMADDTPMEHVTHLLANQKEALEIDEVVIDGDWYGALSWSLAHAIGGAAEQVQDGRLTRGELNDYLYHRVRSVTENDQTPRVLPAPDDTPVLEIAKQVVEPAPVDPGPIRAAERGLDLPSRLSGVEWVAEGADLSFLPSEDSDGSRVTVRNRVGDDLTHALPADDAAAWQRVLAAARLMRAVDAVNQTQAPAPISLKEGDGRHPLGQLLHFRIGNEAGGRAALTVFNVSGNGEIQFLYPVTLRGKTDSPIVDLPFAWPALRVTGPIGGETMVAVLCERPPQALQGLVERAARDKRVPTPDAFLGSIADQQCRIARYPWFSTGS